MTNDPHNFAPPPQTLGYASPYAPNAAPPRRRGRGLIGLVVFVVLAILLFMSLRNQGRTFTTIPYSDFNAKLKPVGETSGRDRDRIEWIRLQGDTVYGKFVKVEGIPERGAVTYFRVNLPDGMSGRYEFFQGLVERTGLAKIEVEPPNNLIINIILPLVPWLLIFSFVWFLIRSSRKRHSGTQLVITGPGRWIPDPPQTPQAQPQ